MSELTIVAEYAKVARAKGEGSAMNCKTCGAPGFFNGPKEEFEEAAKPVGYNQHHDRRECYRCIWN